MADLSHKLIIANWKSNKTLEEALHWLAEVGPKTLNSEHTLVLCPPFPFLVPLKDAIEDHGFKIALGVQDLSPFPAGSYTGAVSERNLQGLGVEYVILGHAEQFKYFNETIQRVSNKTALALEAGLTPIVCVEESRVISQANAMEGSDKKKVIVAYEPAGHIGTGEADSIDHVVEVVGRVRHAFSADTQVIYGGSVDKTSVSEFLSNKDIGGVLVGTASLDAHTFSSLLVL